MINRILITIVIVGTLLLVLKLIRMSQLRTAKRTAATITPPNENEILYFSSAVCSFCSTQERILNEIFKDSEFSDVDLKKYSIEDNTDQVKQWGVKTLPTTILLSKSGEIKYINNSLISSQIMISQLRDLKNS